jgi:hypothetical protein
MMINREGSVYYAGFPQCEGVLVFEVLRVRATRDTEGGSFFEIAYISLLLMTERIYRVSLRRLDENR